MRIKNLLSSITGNNSNPNNPVQCQHCQLYYYEKDMPLHLKFCLAPVQVQSMPAQKQPSLIVEHHDEDEGFVVVSNNTPEKPTLSAAQRAALLQSQNNNNNYNNNYEQVYGFQQSLYPNFNASNNIGGSSNEQQLSDEELARKLYEEELESYKKQQEMEEQLTFKLLQQESAKSASFALASPYKHQQLNNTAVCDNCKTTVDFSKAVFGEVCTLLALYYHENLYFVNKLLV